MGIKAAYLAGTIALVTIGCDLPAAAQNPDVGGSLLVIAQRSREARIRAGHAVTLGWIGVGLGFVNAALLLTLLLGREAPAGSDNVKQRIIQRRLTAVLVQLREAVEIRRDEERRLNSLIGRAEKQMGELEQDLRSPSGERVNVS